jgi:hypothetical protein
MVQRLIDADADLWSTVPHGLPYRSCGVQDCPEVSQAPMLDGWSYRDSGLVCSRHSRGLEAFEVGEEAVDGDSLLSLLLCS